ncbi:PQQ-binding-like beta-propeller repeat protein [Ruania alba]|uniref:Outer membrane protein assembly factor BamB, contains PQQ-like beta-propeller repeat n=1 Tax=Ruania alba TaxID=648782 RepID=A0A1H5MR41_9MICO|nr:PQQ-binding-like beta-propeller repeat protein [Ruania alba]SEE91746.1 Outer membrane protein assembly factor BamB, contains PQQ-like beta-propeller repeat [Ruania alba]
MTHNVQPSRARRSGLIAGVLAAVLALVAAPATQATPSSAVPEASVHDLGPAVMSVNVRSATFGYLDDGTPVAYAISNGNPATFTMVDVQTGESLFAAELDRTTVGGWIEIADDGTVYFSARHPMPAGLFSFDPESLELTHIAERVVGESVLYGGDFGPDGRLYFGTYPHAKVAAYDPTTGEFQDYGSQTQDAAYVFSLGIVDGEVWAGTGPVPHLYAIDPATGERREIHPPEHVMANTQWFIGLDQRADHALIRLSPRGSYDTAMLDLTTGDWSEEIIPSVGGSAPTSLDSQGRTYVLSEGMLTGYDTTTGEIVPTGFAETELPAYLAQQVNTYGIEVMDLPGTEGDVVVGLSTDGDLWTYHLTTGETSIIRAEIAPSPAEAHGLGVGPDGNTYIGAYLSSGSMTRVDAHTMELEPLRGPKQADAIATHGDELIVTSYPGAVVHAGDPAGEWSWGDNPHHVLTLDRGEPYYQDRINGVVSAGDTLALGTIPDYGELGGALTLLDTETGEFDVHRDIVADQSIISLAYADGLIYGGTSISGGLSSTPAAEEARLFIWDVAASSVVWEGVVSAEAGYIAGLSWGADGMLAGGTSDGLLFEFDPQTRDVTWTTRLYPAAEGRRTGWGYATKTIWDERTGTYLATSNGTLYQAHRETGDVTVVADEMEQITRDGVGTIIGVDLTHAYRIDVHGASVACDETIDGRHDGPLRIDAGITCVSGGTVDGPVTVSEGAGLVLTEAQVSGPVRADDAAVLQVVESTIGGAVHVNGTTDDVVIRGTTIDGSVGVQGGTTALAPVIGGNTVHGSLSCRANDPAPVDQDLGNHVAGALLGQCADL